ncbi:peroxiredoxin [Pukyongiella litopenaei]|uniref:thioredoxin-dependent peroxiredoxin n=1 Tax=Pukyongiella litopenaei TaxID=2605946 RepID=A0A2S0MVF7_9RHOB|nr:peroxiredoxin [Pukyongiella litopenaei]AVO39876.1 peroxiredoxin [Pukyongiella litopenaei]
MLEPGSLAPDFDLPRTGGGTLRLSDLRGRKVVLYFYPRDNTPGCTTESVGFSARLGDFDAAGATVIGISKDNLASHDRFVARHDLTVTLVSDADATTCEDYGVWVEKKMYGKTFMGIERATFLIDAEGRIARAWRKVKVPGHVEAVLEAVRES